MYTPSRRPYAGREDDSQESEDKQLRCCDCDRDFNFPAGEQKFYKEKGLKEPRRCKECRAIKKQQREQQENNSY